MSKNINKIIAVILTVFCTILMLYNANEITKRKESYVKNSNFFTEKENIDVLLLGNSHIKDQVFPMELWKDYGIVSYNYGASTFRPSSTFELMKSLIKYHKPKLIVVDCYLLNSEGAKNPNFNFVHQALDAMPFSVEKVKTVYNILNSAQFNYKKMDTDNVINGMMEFLIPFIKYHSRWNQLTNRDIEYCGTEKGATALFEHTKTDKFVRINKNELLSESIGRAHLENIIEYAKRLNIKILLVYNPFPAPSENQKEAFLMEEIAEKNGIPSINFLDKKVVNFDTDMSNKTHLNFSGGLKLTNYLGQYIIDNFDIADHRKDTKYKKWHDDYKKYASDKLKNFNKAKDYNIYLLIASDRHFNYKIKIKDKKILNKDLPHDLIVNAGIDVEKVKNENVNIIEIDNVKNKVKYSYSGKVNQADYKIDFEVIDQASKKVLNKKSYK